MRNISLVLGALVLSLPNLSQAKEKHYPCNGAPGEFRLNPDSSQGGFVAFTATVDSSVVIDLEASVCDQATVLEGAQIKHRAEVSGRATVRGLVEIIDQAKVYGEAYVVNFSGSNLKVQDRAHVYGNGFLQGSVIIADDSEVFGWAKVIHFAQLLGSSKVCADSVTDGFDVLIDDESRCYPQ